MSTGFNPPLFAADIIDLSDSPDADLVHWDLRDLYDTDKKAEEEISTLPHLAEDFGNRHRGQISKLKARGISNVLKELEVLYDRLGRLYTYAYLAWSTDTTDADRGAFLQRVKEAYSKASQELLFFDVEWGNIDNKVAKKIYASPSLSRYAHHLELVQKQKAHQLTEDEEKIISEMSVNGRSAWNRFFDETMGAARFTLDNEELSQQQVLSKLHESDRQVRKGAAEAFTKGLVQHQRPLTYIFNTILADKASADRLREYPNWLSSRNDSNEVEDDKVESLISAVTSRYDICVRFYKLKARVLGLPKIYDFDRYAPIFESDKKIEWEQAKITVTRAYSDFDPRIGNIVKQFFDKNWIDAAVTKGKRGGAFSHGAVPSAHPYIMMNYTGRTRDVQTLAHELGHGVHQYLSREQGVFHADTPLTTAETASVFGEMLTFQSLLAEEADSKNRLSMLMGKIDDSMATVFRQVCMNRFEDGIHTARRESGELSSTQFSDIWMATQQEMFGDSVELTPNYRHWWSYIPHFLHTPGYVYAYAFGELLVLGLYSRYASNPVGFTDSYHQLLSAGGSDYPHNLLKPFGIDLQDPEFWKEGLKAIETLIEMAEGYADKLGI